MMGLGEGGAGGGAGVVDAVSPPERLASGKFLALFFEKLGKPFATFAAGVSVF